MKEKVNINLNNYEAYFLDYHEGSLSPALVKELMGFIAKNPDLREEFESFEPTTLKGSEAITYDKKDTLKKQLTGINAANFDEYAVDYVEGTLPISSEQELKKFISQNPSYQKELELYKKAKLTPDISIIFEKKPSLKRRNSRPTAFYYWSAAASVVVIIGAYFMLNRSESPTKTAIVKYDTIKNNNIVANHNTKRVDISSVVPKIAPSSSTNNASKNNGIVINTALKKHYYKKQVIPDNSHKDSSIVALSGVKNSNPVLPSKKENTIPTHFVNESLALNATLPDTSPIGQPMIVETIVGDTNQQEVATVVATPKKKKGKFLILVATLVCKGLHKITGQHIELEKHYDSDTATIVAHQLDLGNKKFEFPVKE